MHTDEFDGIWWANDEFDGIWWVNDEFDGIWWVNDVFNDNSLWEILFTSPFMSDVFVLVFDDWFSLTEQQGEGEVVTEEFRLPVINVSCDWINKIEIYYK